MNGFSACLAGVVILGVSLASTARAELRTEAALSVEFKDRVFRAELKEGFHFNEDAPNSLIVNGQKQKPSAIGKRKLEFAPLTSDAPDGRASLYICDDAVSFCEPRFIELKDLAQATAGTAPATTAGTARPTEASAKPGAGVSAPIAGASKARPSIDRFGFIENDLPFAFAEAAKDKTKKDKLVLVEFGARWCPGCVRYEAETFGTRKFQELTKSFVKVKIDVDLFENIALAKKYAVKGIPTLLVLNQSQEEIDRIYDYQPNNVLETFFASIHADPTSLQQLISATTNPKNKNNQNKNSDLTARVGRRLFAAERFAESLPYLSAVVPPPRELPLARVGAAAARYDEDPSSVGAYISVLKEVIAAEPESSRALVWRTTLAGLLDDPNEVSKLRTAGVASADRMLKDPGFRKKAMKDDAVGEFTNYEPLLIAMARAELIEASKASTAEISGAWKAAADVGRQLKIHPNKWGPAFRYLIVLTQAGLFQEADDLANALLKREPGHPEIQRRKLKTLLGLGRFAEVVQLGQVCLQNSYGRNEFWVAEVLAKGHLGAGQSEEARRVIGKYLSRNEIHLENMQDSKLTFETLLKSLPQQGSSQKTL